MSDKEDHTKLKHAILLEPQERWAGSGEEQEFKPMTEERVNELIKKWSSVLSFSPSA